MHLTSNTILITGGGSGIGLALAVRFLREGNKVIICGRREDKLKEVKSQYPELHYYVCDVAKEADRIALVARATREFPKLNVLVNNAGIQRRIQLAQEKDWKLTEEEIVINFVAPVHLSQLLLSHLVQQEHPAILNVTSGLAFVPMAMAPIYCATKAAMRSFTLSLRHQLSKTPIAVIEIIPPAVQTDLGGVGLHTTGVPLDEFADVVFAGLKNNLQEISYGFSAKTSAASRQELDETFKRMNQPLP